MPDEEPPVPEEVLTIAKDQLDDEAISLADNEEILTYPTRALLAHPTEPTVVFAGSQKYPNYWDLLVSTDGGETWAEGGLTIQVAR